MAETTADEARQTTRDFTAAAQEATPWRAGFARRVGEAAGGYEELLALSRDGVEGMTRAGQVLLDRTTELNRVWASFWNEQLAEGVETMRTLTECRTWHEALERQNAFTRASVERACARAAQSAELTAGLITESLKPLQENVRRAVVERFPRPAA